MPKNKNIIIFIIFVTFILEISIIFSSRIDEPKDNLFFLFYSIHPSYWFGLIFTTIGIIVLSGKKNYSSLTLMLIIILIAYNDLYFLSLYTRPIFREIYHSAQPIYIIKYGNINPYGYPFHRESISHAIFASSFSIISDLNITSLIQNLQGMYYMLYVLFIYIVLKKITNNNMFSIFGSILLIGWSLQPIGTYRMSFGVPLYILMLIPVNNLFYKKNRASIVIILCFIITLILTHLGLSILWVFTFLIMSIVIYLPSFIQNIEISKKFPLKIGIISFVCFLLFYIFYDIRYNLISAIKKMWMSIHDLYINRNPLNQYSVHITKYSSDYIIIVQLRYIILISMLIVPLTLIMYIFLQKVKKRTIISLFQDIIFVNNTILFVLTSILVIAALYGWYVETNLLVFLPPCSTVLTIYIIKDVNFLSSRKERRKKFNLLFIILCAILFFFVTISSFVKWGGVTTMMQVTTREVDSIKFLSKYTTSARARRISVAGVGFGHGGTGNVMSTAIQIIYADRFDIEIESLGITVIRNTANESFYLLNKYDLIAFSNYLLALKAKYVSSVPFEKSVEMLLKDLSCDRSYNLVYSSGNLYEIFSKL